MNNSELQTAVDEEEGSLSTDREIRFYRKWKDTEKELKYLKAAHAAIIKKLEARGILSPEIDQTSTSEEQDKVYHTDEEQVARDTDWILKKKQNKIASNQSNPNKKRKANSSPDSTPIRDNNLSQHNVAPSNNLQKTHVPPPIFVEHVLDIKILTKPLKAKQFEGKITTLVSKTSYKINCFTGEEYRKVTEWLNNSNIEWHSFSDKQTRPLKVMARGLHSGTSPEDIVEYLTSKGFKATSAVNILCNKTKKPLNLFMLTFDNTEDAKKVYEIKVIEYQTVKIEELHKTSNRIVQCKKCQSYNHVRAYCHKMPRCVKCAGQHDSLNCDKPRDYPPKCSNCNEGHTANYRGCEVAKELQKLRNQGAKNKHIKTYKTSNENLDTQQKKATTSKPIDPNTSYAQIAGTQAKNATTSDHTSGTDTIMMILERMEKRLDQQDQFNRKIIIDFQSIKSSLAGKHNP